MRPNQFYAIQNPKTKAEYMPPEERVWRFEPSTMQRQILDDNIIWPDDNPSGRMTRPRFKTRFSNGEEQEKTNPVSTWVNLKSEQGGVDEDDVVALTAGLNQEATRELRNLFGEQILDYPKPVSLLEGLVSVGSRSDDIILDFFAGSGTTGQAVLELNKSDGGHRKFSLVQLPEPTGRADFPTIADITKARVRRAIDKVAKETKGQLPLGAGGGEDLGFRVFKLADSNFTAWDSGASKDVQQLGEQLSLHMQHVQKGRTGADILYEILLKSGFPLTAPVEKLQLAEKNVFAVAGGMMLICLEHELTLDAIRAMADKKPERVVCLDEGFAGNDQLKTNAVQTFKTKGVVFRTV